MKTWMTLICFACVAGGCGGGETELVRVPNVVGSKESAALGRIAAARLCVRYVTTVFRPGRSVVQTSSRPDVVLEQSPRPGARVALHHQMSLVVSGKAADIRGGVTLVYPRPTKSLAGCPRTRYVDAFSETP
jgi:hypothetical protein